MSSEFSQTISRNLVRVSGSGYRENIKLHEFSERLQPSGMLVSGRAGITGAAMMLARFGDHPEKSFGAAISASLSKHRDTVIPQL
jgi:hydrogenase maturation factor